ncbi:MAG: hypothetical protein Q9174_004539 [Haloplaca sp. 1 TL-2023]
MARDWATASSAFSKIPPRHLAVAVGVFTALFTLIKIHNALPPITSHTIHKALPAIPVPALSVSYPKPSYNESKVAFLVENRPLPMLVPLIIQFMGVMPADWRFRFMGSDESVKSVKSSRAIQRQVGLGKMDLTFIPRNMSTGGQEQISRFLTNLWLYETVLQPAEWLLVFQTDSTSPPVPHSQDQQNHSQFQQASSAPTAKATSTTGSPTTGSAPPGTPLPATAATAASPSAASPPSSRSCMTNSEPRTPTPKTSGSLPAWVIDLELKWPMEACRWFSRERTIIMRGRWGIILVAVGGILGEAFGGRRS